MKKLLLLLYREWYFPLFLLPFFLFLTLPSYAQSVIGVKDNKVYFNDLIPETEYKVEQTGYIKTRTVTADQCGLIKMSNTDSYPILNSGNYQDLYFKENDYWYYWTNYTDLTNYPKPSCQQVGGSYILDGVIWDAGDGTGSISFIVTPEAIYLYHPQLIQPYSTHTVYWYGEWDDSNGIYTGNTRITKLKANSCGIARLNLAPFQKTAYDFPNTNYRWTLKQGETKVMDFNPNSSQINYTPICKKGIKFEPVSYQ